MNTVLAIAAGGALGALGRHYLNVFVSYQTGAAFPFGILACNVLGAFIMGAAISYFAHVFDPPQAVKAFLTVGLLGAFTTFSTFALDTAVLMERGVIWQAALYVIVSLTGAVVALFAGMALVRAVF